MIQGHRIKLIMCWKPNHLQPRRNTTSSAAVLNALPIMRRKLGCSSLASRSSCLPGSKLMASKPAKRYQIWYRTIIQVFQIIEWDIETNSLVNSSFFRMIWLSWEENGIDCATVFTREGLIRTIWVPLCSAIRTCWERVIPILPHTPGGLIRTASSLTWIRFPSPIQLWSPTMLPV